MKQKRGDSRNPPFFNKYRLNMPNENTINGNNLSIKLMDLKEKGNRF